MRKKDIRELGITVILVFVLVIATVNTLRLRKRSAVLRKPGANTPAVVSQAPPVIPQAPAYAEGILEAMDKEARKHELRRDPFTAAPVTSTGTKAGLSLTGIIWDKDSPMAIVNGEVVKTGDAIGNGRVAAIKKDRIVFRDELGDADIFLEQ